MRVVELTTTNPYRNLATEEYLLRHMAGNFFMLWRNQPCIVVGRNQNTSAEINREYVEEHNIAVVRRLTGGGAVFHDLGNLNYTFIEEGAADKFGNYGIFCQPIIEVLQSIGVSAQLSGRNDLLIDGKKFAGNAQTLWHGRMMHHGCIMFAANVNNLSEALRVNPLKIQSKGIKSVRSRVTNITEHLSAPMTMEEFQQRILKAVLAKPGNELYCLTAEDEKEIDCLYREKYNTYDWNFGFAKEYAFQKDTLFASGLVTVSMNIQANCIAAFSVHGDFFGIREVAELEEAMMGTSYTPDAVLKRLKELEFSDYFAGITPEEFVKAMF